MNDDLEIALYPSTLWSGATCCMGGGSRGDVTSSKLITN